MFLQYAVIALAVLVSAGVVAKKQFPGAVRRLRAAVALPLVRQTHVPPLQALGRRMAELSKPMSVMGREMGALGRQRAQAQREAELAMKAVFKQALVTGKAVAATPSA